MIDQTKNHERVLQSFSCSVKYAIKLSQLYVCVEFLGYQSGQIESLNCWEMKPVLYCDLLFSNLTVNNLLHRHVPLAKHILEKM